MNQVKIWDYFQNTDGSGKAAFDHAVPRYRFLAKQFNAGDAVLNIGVGRGGLERLLVQRGVLVSSLDPSDESIERIKLLYRLDDRAKVGFSQAIPFADECFDGVIMSEVLEHLVDETLDASLREVRRVLKPGGVFLGTVPAGEVLAENLVVCPCCGTPFHRWGHVQSFSSLRLRKLLTASNLVVRTIDTRSFPDWRRRSLSGIVKNVARYIMGRYGVTIAVPHLFFKAVRGNTGLIYDLK